MRIAVLAPIAWRTPPRHYGPWEQVASLLTEGLAAMGVDVTLFATADSQTSAKLESVCPRGYEEDRSMIPKVWECLHIANCFSRAGSFDIIHNHFDFLPLSYSSLVNTPVLTTIHGFSSPGILPVYEAYNRKTHYVSISNADRSSELDYVATVHHGIDIDRFTYREAPGEYLLFFGRIHPDKGAAEAVEIARLAGRPLVMAGIIQDCDYFSKRVEPHIDGHNVRYVGSVGPTERDRLLGNALALLHPIDFDEPFGLSVVESMACGTPAIAFERGSMPEIITNGMDGFLVRDIESAVDAVGRIGPIDRAACRRTIENRFTVKRMVENYLEVYRAVVATQRG